MPRSAPVSSVNYLGYRIITANGTIYSHGAARFFGDTSQITLNKPIVGSASTPTGLGYWLVASDGGIFSFGDANFYGSTGGMTLNKPIVGMAATPDGKGYWLVASDGGIFSFGDAHFYGSTGGMTLNKPVVGMAATPDGKGYWLVASDGGIFSFGDATFFGSTGGMTLNKPIVGMSSTPDGRGYWLVASDGGIFTFGDATFFGSQGGTTLPAPVVSLNSATYIVSSMTGAVGFDVSNFQCGLSTPPTSGTFVMVEVNGWPFTSSNPCMAKEATWAQGSYQLYTFMGLPIVNGSWGSTPSTEYTSGPQSPTTLAAQAFNYGYNDAAYALAQANAAGVSSPIWWIDVEGAGTYWTSDPAVNTAAIQGAVDYFNQKGIIAGLYSGHATMYAQITTGTTSGGGATILGPGGGPIPLWFYSSDGLSACTTLYSTTGALNPFAGGIPWYIQTGFMSNYDADVSC